MKLHDAIIQNRQTFIVSDKYDETARTFLIRCTHNPESRRVHAEILFSSVSDFLETPNSEKPPSYTEELYRIGEYPKSHGALFEIVSSQRRITITADAEPHLTQHPEE